MTEELPDRFVMARIALEVEECCQVAKKVWVDMEATLFADGDGYAPTKRTVTQWAPRASREEQRRRIDPFNAFRSLLCIAGDVSAPTFDELYSGEWVHPTCCG